MGVKDEANSKDDKANSDEGCINGFLADQCVAQGLPHQVNVWVVATMKRTLLPLMWYGAACAYATTRCIIWGPRLPPVRKSALQPSKR